MANHDALLAIALDIHDCPNVYRHSILPKLLDGAGDGVRDLIVELLERRFPNELRGKEAQVLRADIVVRVKKRSLWNEGPQAGRSAHRFPVR
jgi:hypothetical protein